MLLDPRIVAELLLVAMEVLRFDFSWLSAGGKDAWIKERCLDASRATVPEPEINLIVRIMSGRSPGLEQLGIQHGALRISVGMTLHVVAGEMGELS